jgi:hypothetical protein
LNPQSKQVIKMPSGYENATQTPVIMGAVRRAGIDGTWNEEYQTVLVKLDRDFASGIKEWPLNKARMDLMFEEHTEEMMGIHFRPTEVRQQKIEKPEKPEKMRGGVGSHD